MSCMQLSQNHFAIVYNKACTYCNTREVTREYCYILSRWNEPKIRKYVQLWAEMNALSCHYHCYERRGISPYDGYLPEEIIIPQFGAGSIIVDCFQMLKALQCIHYNIELEELPKRLEFKMADYKEALQQLEAIIKEIMGHIIDSMSEYKEAKWEIE